MAAILLLLIGAYMIAVGVEGRGDGLITLLREDLPGYVPWVIGVTVLGILSVNDETEKLVKPFLILIFIGILLKDWQKIKTHAESAYVILTEKI